MALGPTEGAGAKPLAAIEPVRIVAPIGDPGQESADRLSRLEVGQQFPAKILSRFDDGTFLLRIADTSARAALPSGGKVGDALLLTLLDTTPRPSFSLDAQGKAIPTLASTTTPTAVSNAGRLITDILSTANASDPTTALVSKVPLTATPGASAPTLASALQEGLSASGLFYESHVSQWAEGNRPLTDLLREPQARGAAMTGAAANAGKSSDASSATATLPALNVADVSPQVMQTRRNLMEYFSAAPLPSSSAATVAASSANGLDPGMTQMIGLQLNVLEQQKVQWQGELWPGQPLTWQVSRNDQADDDGKPRAAEEVSQQHWQSVVSFTLPNLGTVKATIDLTGNQVRVNVRTDTDEIAAMLRRHSAGLATALDAAGSVLDGLTVRRDAPVAGDDR